MLTKEELIDNHLSLWNSIRQELSRRLTNANGLRCVCGKPATGLHLMVCQKFQRDVDKETVNKCNELLDRSNVTSY